MTKAYPLIETPAQLYEKHHAMLLRARHRFGVRNPEDAADCLQNAFVNILRHWGERTPATTLPWAHQVVLNACRDFHRKSKARRQGETMAIEAADIAGLLPSIRSHEGASIARITIRVAIKELTSKQARALRDFAVGKRAVSNRSTQHYTRLKMQKIIGSL